MSVKAKLLRSGRDAEGDCRRERFVMWGCFESGSWEAGACRSLRELDAREEFRNAAEEFVGVYCSGTATKVSSGLCDGECGYI